MTTIMCFGTFDLLHPGHLNYFEQAKKHGDYLIVVIARDHTKAQMGKKMMFSEQERLHLVQSLKIVDKAVLGYPDNHFKIIQQEQPDILCLGYDQTVAEKELKQNVAKLNLYPEIKRMKAYQPHIYKSSLLKKKIKI